MIVIYVYIIIFIYLFLLLTKFHLKVDEVGKIVPNSDSSSNLPVNPVDLVANHSINHEKGR